MNIIHLRLSLSSINVTKHCQKGSFGVDIELPVGPMESNGYEKGVAFGCVKEKFGYAYNVDIVDVYS